MLYSKIIDEIRLIANGKESCSDVLMEILQRQKCLYALSKTENSSSKNDSLLRINQIIQTYMYKSCDKIFQELNEIPYAVIKGAVLSDRIYGKSHYRSSGDIDLLVASKHAEYVTQILKRNGFVQGKLKDDVIENYTREELLFYKLYTHQLASFEKKTDFPLCPFLNIDVNLSVLWGESNQTIDIEEYLLHTEKRSVFGIEVPVLSPVHEFIALCLHHYKDMNSVYLLAERGLCLNEFFDIYYYIINVRPDVDELNILADNYQVKEYVYYCIFYANEIFQHPCLVGYLERLETSQALRMLDCYGLTDSERKRWTIPFSERLLDQDFKSRFLERQGEEESQKIRINKRFM